MLIALAQINPTIGDFGGNADRIVAAARAAQAGGAALMVCPELSVCGYPPMDLLDHGSFVTANLRAVELLCDRLPKGLGVVVGHVTPNRTGVGKALLNVATLLADGAVIGSQAKSLLPSYDVFDEARYFEPAAACRPVPFAGERFGLTICEDIWWESDPDPSGAYARDPVAEQVQAGATLMLAPSASPYYLGKPAIRAALLARVATTGGFPVLYANAVGGNDGLIFDGQSMACAADGRLIHLSPGFQEDVAIVDTDANPCTLCTLPACEDYGEVEAAIGIGLRDYLAKTGHERVCLAISGGIDSAVVAAVAARQLGPKRVTGFALPSRYSSSESLRDAEALAHALGIDFHAFSIEPAFATYLETLAPVFANYPLNTAEENLQARIRGTLVMAFANKTGALALATGNKSELATGYATLYGDMAGALAPIGDLWKTQVYALARRLNEDGLIIPIATIDKPPSAELRPGQLDSDSLPPYEVLDAILQRYVERSEGAEQIATAGFEPELVKRVLQMVARSEHKRRQAATVIKLSPRAFGPGRRFPIARWDGPTPSP